MNRLVRFFCLCSGTRRDVLVLAPESTAQASTLGALMIFIASVSSATAGYALSRVFLGDQHRVAVAMVGGMVWGSIVFCIDRYLVAEMNKSTALWRQIPQVLLRLVFACTIAMVMSTPVLLRLAQDPIDAELRKEEREIVQKERLENLRNPI